METIRRMPLKATIVSMVSSFLKKVKEMVRRAFQIDFLPKDDSGPGGKKGKKGSDKKKDADTSKESPPEWERVDDSGAGNILFARTGGGREDVRPLDFDRYIVIGLSAPESKSDHSTKKETQVCKQLKVSLAVEIDCSKGKDKLVIDRIPKFHKEKMGQVLATNLPGEHTYYTTPSPNVEMEFVTYIPEITSQGAIRVRHQLVGSIANLGVQFFVRAS
jgi:hypothetical protein